MVRTLLRIWYQKQRESSLKGCLNERLRERVRKVRIEDGGLLSEEFLILTFKQTNKKY